MPRGHLTEKYVQRTGVEWLEKRLRIAYNTRAVVGEREVVVRSGTKLGSGRADGLVAAKLPDGYAYTAALEAKSTKTRHNIISWNLDESWMLHACLIGSFGMLLAGITGWVMGGWLWMGLLPMPTFFVAGFAYLLLTSEHYRYRVIDVITQVKRYPADERWVALPKNTYDFLADEDQRSLRESCQRNGIGLILVQSASNIEPLMVAKSGIPSRRRPDFLTYYARGEIVRSKLQDRLDDRRNPLGGSRSPKESEYD